MLVYNANSPRKFPVCMTLDTAAMISKNTLTLPVLDTSKSKTSLGLSGRVLPEERDFYHRNRVVACPSLATAAPPAQGSCMGYIGNNNNNPILRQPSEIKAEKHSDYKALPTHEESCPCKLPNPKYCMLNIVEALHKRMHRPRKQWVSLSFCAEA